MSKAPPYDRAYYRAREATRDFRIEARNLLRLLGPESDSDILEVGCGGGALLRWLAEQGFAAKGVDILPEAVEAARELVPGAEILLTDAGALPFADGSFDRIIAHHLIEHIPEPPLALAEWRRVLRPGGRLAIGTPNRLYASPRIFDDPTHVSIFDPPGLAAALGQAGFEVEKIYTIFPHLMRDKISVYLGVPLYRLFMRLPHFNQRGRTILAAAVRS